MKQLNPRHLWPAGLCVVVAGLLLICGRRYPPGLDSGWLGDLHDDIKQEAQRTEKLETDRGVLLYTNEVRTMIAHDVVVRRLTLAEAAARFRALDANLPRHLTIRLYYYPGRSDEERMCRCVLAYVTHELSDHPQRDAIIAGLEAELLSNGSRPQAAHRRRTEGTEKSG